jgi:hypothetical protein
VVIVVLLIALPVPKTSGFGFAVVSGGSGPSTFNDTYSQTLCPTGASAAVSYTASGSLEVAVGIVNPTGTTIWEETAKYASTTFTVQNCGTYLFDLSGSGDGALNITGSLSYSAPIL